MRHFLILIVVVIGPLSFAQASSCPLAPGATELTITQVMLSFGRQLLAADMVAQNGLRSPRIVSDAELEKALLGIDTALDCVHQVLEHPQGALLPSRVHQLEGTAREAYIQLFLNDMDDFRLALVQYRKLFADELSAPTNSRDFRAIADQGYQVRECARRAHGDL